MTSSDTTSPILITGATGRHGGTGAHLARRLREAGRSVRAVGPGRRTLEACRRRCPSPSCTPAPYRRLTTCRAHRQPLGYDPRG